MFLRKLLLVSAMLCMQNSIFAYDMTVSWSSWDNEKYIDHYKVYWGVSSGIYTEQSIALPKGQKTYTVTGLPTGKNYLFAVKAFDQYGNESNYSNEISAMNTPKSPTDLTVTR